MIVAPRWIVCPKEQDTVALGERIGEALVPGDLLQISGPLGAGKTVLVRGIAIGAGADPRAVRSPTFVLHHVYPGERLTLHHIDLYRLGALGTPHAEAGAAQVDVTLLALDDLLEEGAVAVEWGEMADLGRYSPVAIVIDPDAAGGRRCTLSAGAPERLVAAWHGAARAT
jgi:tRNA threonylcarbamoyladenosine biosynthesis protein TsaE